jgi:hypothetical protein
MKAIAALLTALPLAALAAPAANDGASPGFHQRLFERYCGKLRESPEAYVGFVKRMMPLHGYTFSDFAPARPGDAVLADCHVGPQRVAEVNRLLQEGARGASR